MLLNLFSVIDSTLCKHKSNNVCNVVIFILLIVTPVLQSVIVTNFCYYVKVSNRCVTHLDNLVGCVVIFPIYMCISH